MIEIIINNNGWKSKAKLVRLPDGQLIWKTIHNFGARRLDEICKVFKLPVLHITRASIDRFDIPFQEGDLEKLGAEPPDFWTSVEDNLKRNKDVND